ncbi:MAG: arylsulfatase [Phycisphaeraceae bacterium]|nr:arylsulfatase [Phycisphaeraceae bacterium]
MKFTVWTVLATALCLCSPSLAFAKQPNIVFIMADDLGYGDLGCYGQRVIQTPHIDALARAGMRFTQCYTGSTVCAPSRSTLMTGKHTGHTTVRGNFGKGGVVGLGGKDGRVPLKAQDVTVAECLKQAGYVTGMTGKWGLGEPGTSGEPNRQGFDQWFGYLNQRRAHTYYPTFIWRNQEKVMLNGNQDRGQKQYTHDMFTEFALDFIRDHQTEPFFLYLPYCIPHSNYEIPTTAPYANQPWKKDEKVHAAMITRMDGDVGRILTQIETLHLADNTIVFFCSDNGAAERWEGRFDSSGSLRGRKRDLYEGGIRTPMIVRWPGKIRAGSVSNRAWYFPDVLPTLAEIAGIKAPQSIDGLSVLPTLLSQPQDLTERRLYWEFFEKGFQQAMRWRHWKVIRQAPGQALELYDLRNDPGETKNVAGAHPDVVITMETYLKAARTNSEAWPVTL